MNFDEIMEYNKPYNKRNFDSLFQNIADNKVVPYVGAGMSMLFKDIYPLWSVFLNNTFDEFCSYCSKDEFNELGYEDKADFLYNEIGDVTFSEYLKKTFAIDHLNKDKNEFIDKAIYYLPIIFDKGLILTTNYDWVIEKMFLTHNRPLYVANPGHFEALNRALRAGELLLFKIHGDIKEPINTVILTKEQYDKAYSNDDLIKSLTQVYISKSILFLGCSLEKDRPLQLLCEKMQPGMNNYAIISCNNEEKKDRRLKLEKEYYTQAIIYPEGKHECVKIILEQIAKKINPNTYEKIRDEYYDSIKRVEEYQIQHSVTELSESDVHNEKGKKKAKVDDINFAYKVKICKDIKRLLIENYRIFISYGPRSEAALKNPLSNTYEIWKERKHEKIIPNNDKIVHIIEENKELFTIDEYEICYEFIEHANGFKKSCDLIMEDIKQFPENFGEVINKYARA